MMYKLMLSSLCVLMVLDGITAAPPVKPPVLHKRGNEQVNKPASVTQDLDNIWKELEDQYDEPDFNPKTFAQSNLNGNGYWNAANLQSLFQQELNKHPSVKQSLEDIWKGVKKVAMANLADEFDSYPEPSFDLNDLNADSYLSPEDQESLKSLLEQELEKAEENDLFKFLKHVWQMHTE